MYPLEGMLTMGDAMYVWGQGIYRKSILSSQFCYDSFQQFKAKSLVPYIFPASGSEFCFWLTTQSSINENISQYFVSQRTLRFQRIHFSIEGHQPAKCKSKKLCVNNIIRHILNYIPKSPLRVLGYYNRAKGNCSLLFSNF